jgi:serine/threonine protein kinase/tetratricopeptide (TPR) repeat protein
MPLSTGDRLGRYEILGPLGAGGMGEVYRARDSELERDVAIKVLPVEVAQSPDRLARFEKEAKAVARLSHPNILDIHDYGREGDTTYSVTELLEGETLRERLEGGPLGWRKATEIGAAIADGLGAAHEAGIVHRDLKPSNVFIISDGRVKVLDFGLARHEDVEAGEDETHAPTMTRQTDPGTVLGTVGYMSPEQVRGETVDQRSDIFSLGCVLYEMVSGRQTFKGDTAVETMNAILKEEPEDVSSTGVVLPSELAGTIRRCLEKRSQSRFQSASDLAYNLRTISSASAPSVIQETPLTAGRKRWAPWAAVAAVFVAVLAVVLWRTQMKPPTTTSPDRPKRIAVLPFENLGPAEDDYVAGGITDEVRGKLTAVSGLEPIARASSNRYRGTDKLPDEIAEELNVQYLLTGQVRWQKAGGEPSRIRVTPELVEVKEDGPPVLVWQDAFEAPLEDIFDVQVSIAGKVIESLEVTLLEPEQRAIEARPTDNMDAYNAYLRGGNLSFSYDAAELDRAVAMFEGAVELDPDFALAYVALSGNHTWAYFMRMDATEERMAQAKRAADRALEIDPDLPEGHQVLGYYYDRCLQDSERAFEEYGIAARHRPNDAGLLSVMAGAHERKGRWQEAVEGFERAYRLDPQNYTILSDLAIAYLYLRRFEEASSSRRPAQRQGLRRFGFSRRWGRGTTRRPCNGLPVTRSRSLRVLGPSGRSLPSSARATTE